MSKEINSDSIDSFVIIRRNDMLDKATAMQGMADTIYIDNWEVRETEGQLNIVFAFDEDWQIDDICVAKINIHYKRMELNIFHDESMDTLVFNLASLTEAEFGKIYTTWIANDLNFVALSLDESGKEVYLMLPTKIIKKQE